MARNDDRARARRAKRRGEEPSEADAAAEPTPPGLPDDQIPGDVQPDDSMHDDVLPEGVTPTQHAENMARAGISGGMIEMSEPTEFVPQTDFDPAPGGEVVGGEVSTGGGPRIIKFFRASWAELKRVRWPDRQQTAQGTAVTLGFVVIAGAYLGLADVLAQKFVDLIL